MPKFLTRRLQIRIENKIFALDVGKLFIGNKIVKEKLIYFVYYFSLCLIFMYYSILMYKFILFMILVYV